MKASISLRDDLAEQVRAHRISISRCALRPTRARELALTAHGA